jgi:zinc transport system permease protein
MNIIETLQNMSNYNALIGGVLVAITTAILGVFVTLKKEAFISDGLAHGALAGVAIAVLISFQPFYIALLTAVFMAIGVVYLKRNTNISTDSLIGIFFTLLFSFGLFVLSLAGDHELELETYLFGSVASIETLDLIFALLAFLATSISTVLLYKILLYMTIDPEAAQIRGVKVAGLDYLIAILTSVAIITSIKLVGVLLATAMLLIPASNAKLLAGKFSHMIPISIIHGVVAVIAGVILASEAPPGATIVLISGGILFVSFVLKKLRIV